MDPGPQIWPQLQCAQCRPGASPLPSAMQELLLPVGRELLVLRSYCAAPSQELSQLREISISLFRDLMKMVVGNDKRKMKNMVRLGLLPLFFRMSDQVQSVAKVAREALLGAAELLRWKQLEDLVQAQQKWRIGESLLEQDRSRAEEYLSQSLLYLGDAQASLREAALRFIGESQPPGPSFGSLAPVPAAALAQGAALWLPEPRLPRAGPWPPLPALPMQVALVGTLPGATISAPALPWAQPW
ncbi:uncharacterized protein LOC110356051 isoform X1 [Columba livia]|uniref:uncharacterized protein LOC110356051 isoform X1 n=1 Tax=Columba livia TaxID=8932 RepID=UPI0031BACBA7